MTEYRFTAEAGDAGKRVDKFLCERLENATRNAVQIMLESGKATKDGQPIKKNYKVNQQDCICITIPDAVALQIIPQDIPLEIVFEDDDIIVINKQRGLVVHPAAGNWDGTLVNALMFHCGSRLSGINGEVRPGIVHRIDKDTSGLLIVAKNDFTHQHLVQQIQRHDIRREYEAIVCGTIREEEGTVDRPIGRSAKDRKKMAVVADGRPSITHYRLISRYDGYSHMAFQLETGRTHQIRVHMASIGHPIVGDPLYGAKNDKFAYLDGQCLHAIRLALSHPRTEEYLLFETPRPMYFEQALQKLNFK